MSTTNWTKENIGDLSGKTIIVTGGNSGLGFESVKAFAEKGAKVILATRKIENGEKAKKEIGNTKEDIAIMQLDLQDFSSIRNFASAYKKQYHKLDILLNNAGIMTTPYFLTNDGLEGQMGTNHFGHYMLTGLLMDLIKGTPNSRVVNVSSSAHKAGKMNFDNLLFENGKDYSPMKAYGRSKLSNLLFTYELQRLFEENNIDSQVLSSHPGGSRTNLDRHIKGKWWFKILWPIFKSMTMDQAQGALPQIRACVDPKAKGGEYYGPNKGMTGFPIKVDSNKASHDINDAKQLWESSEKLTEIIYKFS